MQKTIFAAVFLVITFALPSAVFADVEGAVKDFFVDDAYDWQGRAEVAALLHKVSDEGYFYIEEDWYNNLTEGQKEKIRKNLETVSQEFSQSIYPQLTKNYGTEWNPGIDSDKHITLLFHRMPNEAAGYFKSQDETSRLQSSQSNEREMVYLNSEYLLLPIVKSYLAHEFTHLITFHQKEHLRRTEEEVWLNEARAEYAPTLLGYDDSYPKSNLEQRVNTFLDYPSDSLTEWTSERADYGVIAVFVNYLVNHYGRAILADSLQGAQVGIPSLEQALRESYLQKEFWEVFADWLVAVFLNDCRENSKYCYKNENLQYLKVSPSLIFLPPEQKTEFSVTNDTTYWAGNWYRIIGGADKLEVVFQGDARAQFKVPYALCKESLDCSVGALELNDKQGATLVFDNFNEKYASLTLMPFVISKKSGFNGTEERFYFSIKATATPKISLNPGTSKQELIAQLKAQIAEIKAKLAQLQVELELLLSAPSGHSEPVGEESHLLARDLYLGIRGDDVKALQQLLVQQGPEIYPEGLLTGYFGILTQKAVIKFQEKYANEVLQPLGLTKGTGYVGSLTRAKINNLISNDWSKDYSNP